MSRHIRTLLLESNGTHWVAVCLDTLGHGILSAPHAEPAWLARTRFARKLFGNRYAEASYLEDWRDAFLACPSLEVTTCNISDLIALRQQRAAIRDYDLIIVLHSAAGDRMSVLQRTAAWFQGRRGRLALFVGNEYDLLEEKIAFAKQAGADYICSQLPIDTARTLYQDTGATVIEMPHALNPDVYFARPGGERQVDVGFAGDLYDRVIGDRERTNIVEFFRTQAAARGLRADIRTRRMPRDEWATFLNRCHTICGAESGTYYLQASGAAVTMAKAYLKQHPGASFEEVRQACFADCGETLNGKAISSRHFEPIGTRTCQILIEGAYNGILQPHVHYIPVRRDLSDIDEAIRRAMDPIEREAIVAAAHTHVMSAHTYAHRVRALISAIR